MQFKGTSYDETQKRAIKEAVMNNVFILTGGPGTGKTYTVNGMIQFMRSIYGYVRLAAPTGRAAKRIQELCGEEAVTIHRLLECDYTGHFARNESWLIDADVVIIDESSMIDIRLMYSLLRAIPDGAKVIFVGDVDQLPSVGPGNVLSDMIESGEIPYVRLDTLHRQDAQSFIARNARHINHQEPLEINHSSSSDFLICKMDTQRILKEVLSLYDTIPKYYSIPADRIQVLVPTHTGMLGTENLNRVIRDKLNPMTRFTDTIKDQTGREFRTGDRVMQIVNDYDKNVFNGDTGTIHEIIGGTMFVDIDGGEQVAYKCVELPDNLVLSYAITIHKSQGSEYAAVIAPLSVKTYGKMLSKTLLYTCVTRAKKLAVLLDDGGAVPRAIANDAETKRNTNLKKMIKEAM